MARISADSGPDARRFFFDLSIDKLLMTNKDELVKQRTKQGKLKELEEAKKVKSRQSEFKRFEFLTFGAKC